MARAKSAAQWIGQMHARGRSYAEIGRATGHSPSFIRKVASGDKKGLSLTPTVKRLAQTDARRATGTARPLPNVTASTVRREQRVRTKQAHVAAGGGTTFYVGKRPGPQILTRIQAAARKGKIVQLSIRWKQAQPYPPKLPMREHETIEVWKGGGIDAIDAVQELIEAGYTDHPVAALANITTEQIQWESVKGAEAWQLIVRDAAQTDWE